MPHYRIIKKGNFWGILTDQGPRDKSRDRIASNLTKENVCQLITLNPCIAVLTLVRHTRQQ